MATDFLIDKLHNQTKGWNPETCLSEKLNVTDIENWQNVQKTSGAISAIESWMDGKIRKSLPVHWLLVDRDFNEEGFEESGGIHKVISC